MHAIRIAQTAEVRAVNRAERTIDIVASDSSVDSYQTRIDQSGWDLEQFKRNPVVLFAHNDRTFTAGKALPETIRVEGGELKMRIKFPEEGVSEEHDLACYMYSNGFMRGISVGFVPLEYEDRTEGSGDMKRNVRVYTKSRLLEVSLVAIPSNDNAFAQRATVLNADLETVLARARRFEELIDSRTEKYAPEFVEKCVAYFEKKQPVNKAASRVMEKYFKRVLKRDQPADEVEAWKEIEDSLNEPVTASESTTIAIKPAEPVAATEENILKAAEEIKEEVQEEDTQPSTPVPEAPEPERKASARIPLSRVLALPRSLNEVYKEAAAEALRQGMPVKDLDGYLDKLGVKLKESLLSH